MNKIILVLISVIFLSMFMCCDSVVDCTIAPSCMLAIDSFWFIN